MRKIKQYLTLRLFVEVDDQKDAEHYYNIICKTIEPYCIETSHKIERYWKIPEHFEIFLIMSHKNDLFQDYEKIKNLLGTGWETTDVWGDERPFIEIIFNLE